MLILTELTQDIGRFILVHLRSVLIPDVDMVLAERQQHGDILFRNHMALAETRILRHTADNLRDILTKHLSDCLDRFHFFHCAQFSYL